MDFEEVGKEDWVWKLQQGLYGMKQSGRIWNKTLNDQMLSWGFTRLSCELCVYYQQSPTGTIVTAVHVDDFLSISSSKVENERFKSQMRSTWTISDLGPVHLVVGIAVQHERATKKILLSQTALIDKVISMFGQLHTAPISTPMDPGLKLRCITHDSLPAEDWADLSKYPYRSLVGCLLYLSIGTWPDISYAVQQLSQFLDSFSHLHWNAAIHVVQYLKRMRELRLSLGGNSINLLGFTDSDWDNFLDTRWSVGGYAFSLGSGLISWNVQKEKTVGASSCEAEYVAAFEAAREAVWLRTLLNNIDMPTQGPTTILCNNNASITLSGDPLLHACIKHIDIKYHFLRKCVQSKELAVTIRILQIKGIHPSKEGCNRSSGYPTRTTASLFRM